MTEPDATDDCAECGHEYDEHDGEGCLILDCDCDGFVA
jgi:hypothetical protein